MSDMVAEFAEIKKREQAQRIDATASRYATRDNLYFNFRYSKDSYKARKAMILPFLMVARREGQSLKLYDNGSHQPTKNQELAANEKFKGWRVKEHGIKQLQMPAYRKWRKEQGLSGDHFSHWLINVGNLE